MFRRKSIQCVQWRRISLGWWCFESAMTMKMDDEQQTAHCTHSIGETTHTNCEEKYNRIFSSRCCCHAEVVHFNFAEKYAVSHTTPRVVAPFGFFWGSFSRVRIWGHMQYIAHSGEAISTKSHVHSMRYNCVSTHQDATFHSSRLSLALRYLYTWLVYIRILNIYVNVI